MNPSVAIEIRELTRSFGDTVAVVALSLDVHRGELFGLVGPDGAGKTTTMRMLAGVLPPTSGDAWILGASVSTSPERVKHHIAYMSQRFGLYTDLTVEENIRFYADVYRVPNRERASRLRRLYEFSNLAPFAGRLAGQLSGGMKQKLSLCCALIHRPDVLLLDEPTFGVDPISRRDLWLIIHQMVSEGVTVFVSTAYLDEAERCDRIAMLNHGRAVAVDAPQTIQETLGHRILTVLTDDPRTARNVAQAASSVQRVSLFGASLHLTFQDPERDWPEVRDRFVAAGLKIHDVATVAASLEDAFIHVVSQTGRPDA
jgi:ABC-2 type transport system ATP-binding protein